MSLPGFVDLQVNGYAGVNYNAPDMTVEKLLESAEALRRLGTAGFLLTVVTAPAASIERAMRTAAQAIRAQGPKGPILGIHLEGPFISSEYGFRGVHPEAHVRKPDLDWFRRLQGLAEGNIRYVTVAPEAEGAADFIRAISGDVLVAAGHTNGAYAPLRAAIDAGLRLVTHFANGCRQQIDRHDNPLVNMLACPELIIGFIPDGHHLPDPFLRMLLNCVPVERLFAVSDSVHFGGLPPGVYESSFGTIRKHPSGKLSTEHDHKVLAGSCANMMECMNKLASLGVCSEADLLRIGYENPLRLLGLDPAEFAKRGGAVSYDAATKRFTVKTERDP